MISTDGFLPTYMIGVCIEPAQGGRRVHPIRGLEAGGRTGRRSVGAANSLEQGLGCRGRQSWTLTSESVTS